METELGLIFTFAQCSELGRICFQFLAEGSHLSIKGAGYRSLLAGHSCDSKLASLRFDFSNLLLAIAFAREKKNCSSLLLSSNSLITSFYIRMKSASCLSLAGMTLLASGLVQARVRLFDRFLGAPPIRC